MPASVEQKAKDQAAKNIMDASQADVRLPEDPGADFDFVPGKPLPEGFENPPHGNYSHRCVNKFGNYDPAMFSFQLYKSDPSQSQRQFINNGVKAHFVLTDIWMDVPRYVVRIFEETVIEETEMVATPHDGQQVGLTAAVMVARVVRTFPRFHFRAIPSA